VGLVARRGGEGAALASIVLLGAVSLGAHATYLEQRYGPAATRPLWLRIFDEHRDVLDWVREHVPQDQVVAAINPALVHLYTGHRTIGFYQASDAPAQWRRLGVRYLADTSYLGKNGNLREGRFPTLHRSQTLNLRVLDVAQ
jgi:hypothetical protein